MLCQSACAHVKKKKESFFIMVLSRLQAWVLPSVSFVLATWASRMSRSRFCSVAVKGHGLKLCRAPHPFTRDRRDTQ